MSRTTAVIVGCGDVAAVHAEALQALESTELVGVCDTDPQALASAAARYAVPGSASLPELLEQVRPDAVHVCTPHDQHTPVVVEALQAGVHVLTEKPVAATLAEAERMVRAARGAPATVGVCFQNRYNATSQAAREILETGELGPVLGASAAVVWTRPQGYYRVKPWRGQWERAGGGLLINQAIHTLDLLHWLVGPVESVSGHAATRVYGELIEVEDTAELVLRHQGGARSVFYGTTGAVVNEPVRLEIVCERGRLSIAGDLTVVDADGGRRTVSERTLSTAGRSYWGASHQELIRDFHARLEDPEPFWISPEEGLASLRILKEVYRQSGFTAPGAA